MDIGLLASYARTALTEIGPGDDPGPPVDAPTERERWRRAQETARMSEKADVSDWMSTADAYVVDCLDAIIAVTDPVDDERELFRCADALEILGGHIERIREQLCSGDAPALADVDDRADVSQGITVSLDHLDGAIEYLRRVADPELLREES